MQLLLARLITTCVISATLLAQAGLSHGQQDDRSLAVAVLDVQKVLDSMPEFQKELKAFEELEASTTNSRPVFARCRQPSPINIKANALVKAFSRIRNAAAEIAESKNINLVMRAQTTGLSNGDALKLEQVGNANETKIVYRDNLNLTQAVIERLQQTDKNPLAKIVEEDENAKPVIAIIDVKRVVRLVHQSESFDFEKNDIATQQKLKATHARMRTAVSDLSKIYGIKAVLTGDTDGFSNELRTLVDVNKAISNPLVYHRRLDLTQIVSQHLKNDAKKQASR